MANSCCTRRALLSGLGTGIAAGLLGAKTAHAEEERGKSVHLAATALGQPMDTKKPHSHEQSELAKSIGKDVVCLCGTCPKRLITDCECGWAVRNQNVILNAVVDGKTRDDIVGAYRKAFGPQVLAMLPNEGFAVTAWALPYAFATLGAGAAFLVGRAYLKKRPEDGAGVPEAAVPTQAVTEASTARSELERELEELD